MSRKKKRLPLLGNIGDDFVYFILKSHVKDMVGFIKDKRCKIVKPKRSPT